MSIPGQLLSFIRQYRVYLDKICRLEGITPQQAFIILAIPFDGIRIHSLALNMGLHISTMTRNIKKMEKLKLLNRTLDRLDKRSSIISLSKYGRSIKISIETNHEKNINKIIGLCDIKNQLEFLNSIESLSWEMKKNNMINE